MSSQAQLGNPAVVPNRGIRGRRGRATVVAAGRCRRRLDEVSPLKEPITPARLARALVLPGQTPLPLRPELDQVVWSIPATLSLTHLDTAPHFLPQATWAWVRSAVE